MKKIDYCLKISLDGFKVTKLSEDQTFEAKSNHFAPIAEQIKQIKFDQKGEDSLDFNKYFGFFIMTEGAKSRLLKIKELFEYRFPVLLEGPTGTSKTKSVEILSQLMNSSLVKFNLSSETTVEDLLGRITNDKETLGDFSYTEGPFIDAFINGKWLLLDEINLATQSVLQCMEAALDSHQIFLEIPGKSLKKYKEHPNFRIIATKDQNDALTTKFLSRFIKVEFPEIQKDELFTIASKQAEFLHYNNIAFVKDLIEFHHEWSHREDVKNTSNCFTIREITATIRAIQEHKNPYDAIMTIYGIRYPMKIREEMFNLIKDKYHNLLSKPTKFEIPKSFPKCFINNSLINTLKYIDMAFQSKRHVLLIGKEGTGLTQIGRWVAEFYSNSEDGKKHDYCFICTPKTTISDWIGQMIPATKNNSINNLKIWNDGPLVKSIKKGFCIYFDSLSECPANVNDKLNRILDPKIMEGDMKFDIPENPNENQIDIHQNFKLIASCTYDKLELIPPNLLNRFNLVYLDDQLFQLEDERKKELITFLFNKELSKSIKFDVPLDIIEKLNESIDIKDMNMSKIADICKSTARIIPYSNGLDSNTIISFIKSLIDSQCQDCQVPEILKYNLLSKFTSNQSESEEPFYYQDSESLKNLMAMILSCSIIRKHICLVGGTGIGKTSMAGAFSEKTSKFQRRGPYSYQLYHFSNKSQIEDIYGSFLIDKSKPKIAKGPLYHALEKGLVFIADDLNLAEDSIIQSLAVGLESSSGSKILIPGIGKSIKCNKKFMFIGCQNDTDGIKMFPPNIAKKLRIFTYPSTNLKDLETNCRTIAKTEVSDGSVTQDQANQIANLINQINNSKIPYINPLSMRDVRKLFKRISDNLINSKKYLNFKIVHHILFYIMSSIPEDVADSIFDSLMKIITDCFGIDSEEAQKYKDCYFQNPEFEKIGDDTYLMKGDIGVLVPKNIITHKIIKETKLYSLWNTLFKMLIVHYKEPILIAGNSGFKTFLSSLVEPNAQIISLHNDSNISQLLGSIVLLNSKKAKEFYLEEFCKILQIKSEFPNLLLMLNKELDIPISTNSSSLEKNSETNDNKDNENDQNNLDKDSGSDIQIDSSGDEEDNEYVNNRETDDNIPDFNDHLSKFGKHLHILLDANFIKNAIPESFKVILEHLINIIIRTTETSNDESGLGNFTTIFKPGLLLSASFEQYPLIIKDLTNLPPAVIEKFNNNTTLSLTEDISDTFTTYNTRNLKIFSNNFRVISLCSADALENLSNITKSRVTVISCPGYSDAEQKNAIISLSFTIDYTMDIAKLFISFYDKYYEKFDRYLPFPYITKILQMIDKLRKNNNNLNLEEIFIISIFRIICSSQKDITDKNKIIEIFETISNIDIANYKSLVDCSYKESVPFYQKLIGNTNHVFSTISNISIPCPETNLDQSSISFVSPFVDMVDSIFTGLSIHYPVIIEGISGNGKHTAIKYVADILGYKIITFGINSATTVEDLFCKTIPTRKNDNLEFISQFSDLINSETCDEKTIIVLEEINQASSALLESLSLVFDSSKDTILLPNGGIIQKGKYNIIALYDPCSQTIGNGLPNSFRINSIYHTVPQYSNPQINKIALKIFNVNKFTNDQKHFLKNFHTVSKFSQKSGIPELYTLNDINKYKLFTDDKFKELKSSIVANMILIYKYSQKEDINDAADFLKIDITDMCPKFYIENNKFCATLTSNENMSLSIDINSDHINKSLSNIKNISSLTLHQRNCLLFLMCSVISKQGSILLGPTASGKSYIIKYFTKLLGKKLSVIQVKKDTRISTLIGQFAPSNLKHEDSTLIKAMQQGNWLLIDGIESAPKELFEKIISLCSSDPILNLYERGTEYIYSRNSSGEFKIHDDFRLFITYNPYNIESSRRISPSFLNKYVTFVLQPIDETNVMSSIVINGIICNYLDNEDLNSQISARLANVHEYVKSYSDDEPSEYTPIKKVTGRSLLYNTRIIQRYYTSISSEVIAHFLYKCIQLNYCSSHKKTEEFYNELLAKLLEEPKIGLLLSMKKISNLSDEKYKNLFYDLFELQTNINDSCFKLKTFFMKMLQFEIGDINQIIFHIADTLDKIDTPQLVNRYGNLSILLQILASLYEKIQSKKMKNEEYSMKLDNKILLKKPNLSHNVSQIYCIQLLTEEVLLIEYTPICFYSPSSQNALVEISNLLIDFNFNKLISIISIILNTPSFYYEAPTFLNCDIIQQSEFSNVLNLLPLFIQLKECQIPFTVNKQDISTSIGENEYKVEFSISENNFELNNDSKIFCNQKIIDVDPSKFYSATCYLVDCIRKKIKPNFENEFPTINYSKIPKSNNPLFSLFPSNIKSKVLILLKTAILLEYPVNNNLSTIFGKFEIELITIFNEIWNNLCLEDFKSVLKLVEKLMKIESESSNLFNIIYKDSDNLPTFKEICKLRSLFLNIINDSTIKFSKIDIKLKKTVQITILQTTLAKWIEDLESKIDVINDVKLEIQDINKQRKYLIRKLSDAITTCSDRGNEILCEYKKYLKNLEITPETVDLVKRKINDVEPNVEKAIKHFINCHHIHAEICTIFLEYSKTLKLLDNIQNNREVTLSLFELLKNTNLKMVIEEFSQYLFSNSDETVNPIKEKYINNIKSFARALTIKQLIFLRNDDATELLNNPEKMKEEFEKFIDRNEVDDNLERWASEISLKYDLKDIIHIPRYTPSDIQALFIYKKLNNNLKNDQESSLSVGIYDLLTIFPSKDLYNSLSELNCEKYKTLLEYLDDVSKITLKVLYEKQVDENFENTINEEIKNNTNVFVELISKLYPFCRAQDSRKPINFSQEDLFFFKSDWTKEKELCAKYPSLTYWLIANPEFQQKLRFSLNDLEIQEDSLPLFLHICRILSSMKCIEFKITPPNDTSKLLSNIILENLKPKIKNNISLSMKWLNILLPNIPIDFYDSEVSLIYDFFKSFSQNQKEFKSEICKQCQIDLLKTIIKEMIDSVFQDQIHQYLTDELNNQFTSFIKNPHESMKQKIEQTFMEEQKNTIQQIQHFIKSRLEISLASIRNIIQNDNINKAIDEDIKERNNKQSDDKNPPRLLFCGNKNMTQENYPLIIKSIFDNSITFYKDALDNKNISHDFFEEMQGKIKAIFSDIKQVIYIECAVFIATGDNARKTTDIINQLKISIEISESVFKNIKKIVNTFINIKTEINFDIQNSLVPITLTLHNIKVKKKEEEERKRKEEIERLKRQQKDFEAQLQSQKEILENQKKEFENQMNQMNSMLELIMKQQAEFAKQNEKDSNKK